MKTLYISYDGMTDPLGQSQVIPYLEGLSKNGHQIHLISCEKPSLFIEKKELISKILNSANINWHPVLYTSKPPVLSTLWDIYKIKKLATQLHIKNKFQAVHCRSYISALIGEELKLKYNIKFIFDMRGFWADERVDGGLWNLQNQVFKNIYNYFKNKEKDFLKNADAIISLTDAAKQYMIKTFHVENSKITVIPCATDLNLFKASNEESISALRKRLGINEADYVISYIGSLGTWYLLDEMLDFFVELKKQKKSSKFLFVTAENPDYILRKALTKNISNSDIIIKKADRKEMPLYISIGQASLFFIKDSFSKMASSPTKHGEILSCHIPVVCNKIGDLDKIVNFRKTGLIVEKLTSEDYLKAIKNLLEGFKPSTDDFDSTTNEFYSLLNGIEKYDSIYNGLK